MGQNRIRGFFADEGLERLLCRTLDGCTYSGQPFPHSLVVGPSGFGKSRLAAGIGEALGTHVHEILCEYTIKREKLAAVFRTAEAGDIIFLDEVHALRPETLELCYRAMDKAETLPDDPNSPSVWQAIQPISIIAATDRPGNLRNAYKRRCSYTFFLNRYSPAVLIEMAYLFAANKQVLLTPDGAEWCANACRGNPRSLRLMLEHISPHASMQPTERWDEGRMREFFSLEGIGEYGLTAVDREYIAILGRLGRPISVTSLAMAIGLDNQYLRTEVEPFLLSKGWVIIASGGRTLTPAGKELALSLAVGAWKG